MRNLIFFLLLLTALPASSQVVAGNYTPGFYSSVNYVKNPSCILNDANITDASGIVSRTTASPITEGLKASCLIDGTASAQVVKFTMSSFDTDLDGGNCEASFSYRGDASLYKVYVESPVSTKISADVQLTDTGSTTRTERINFPCGVRADAKALVLETTGASPAGIKVGNAYGGKATNVGSTQLISEWTSYTPIVTALGGGAVSNYTAYGKWRQVGDTMEVDISIQFSAASSAFTTPAVSIPSAYTIDTSKLPTSVTLGAKPLGHVSLHDSGTSSYTYNGKASYYSTTVVELEWWNTTNTANTAITNTVPFTFISGDEIYTRFSVPIVGWTAQTTASINAISKRGSAYFATGNDIITSGTATAFNDASFSSPTLEGQALAPTTANDVGIRLANAPAGVYEVTANGWFYAYRSSVQTSTNCVYDLYDGTSSRGASVAGAPNVSGVSTLDGIGSVSGTFTLSSAGTMNVVLRGQRSSGDGACYVDGPVSISIKNVSQPSPAIVLANSVSTSATNGLKTESATLTCSGSSSIGTQLGGTSWISSIGNISVGVCSVVIAAGTFSGTPQCQATWSGGGSNSMLYTYLETSTGFSIGGITDAGGNSTSFTGKVMCVGPR